jgi:hypothetical protein
VAAEQVVELVAHLVHDRLLEILRIVGSDLLEDAGRLGQHARQGGEPLERGAEVAMPGPLAHDAIEVGERRGVVAHLVERLAHEELGALLARLRVLGLLVEDLGQLDRCRVVVLLLLVQIDRAGQGLGGRLVVGRRRLHLRLGLGLVRLEGHLLAFVIRLVLRRLGTRHGHSEDESDDRQGERELPTLAGAHDSSWNPWSAKNRFPSAAPEKNLRPPPSLCQGARAAREHLARVSSIA